MSDGITKPAESAPKAESKSWVQGFVDRAHRAIEKAPPSTPGSYVRETASTVGGLLEGGVVGSLLGAGHAKWNLDTKNGPVDLWIAGMSSAAAVLLSSHAPELSAHARSVGRDAWVAFTFRKGYEVVNHAPLPGGSGAGTVTRIAPNSGSTSINGEDAIDRVAKGLDL